MGLFNRVKKRNFENEFLRLVLGKDGTKQEDMPSKTIKLLNEWEKEYPNDRNFHVAKFSVMVLLKDFEGMDENITPEKAMMGYQSICQKYSASNPSFNSSFDQFFESAYNTAFGVSYKEISSQWVMK